MGSFPYEAIGLPTRRRLLPSKAWALSAAALSLLLAVGIFLLREATRPAVFTGSLAAAGAAGAKADRNSSLSFTVLNGDYPVLATLELYGFEHLAEPYRNSTLVADGGSGGSDAIYLWTVFTQSGEIDGQYSGIHANHVFKRVPETYSVTLVEVQPSGLVLGSVSGKVTCKYVRRDTHRTSDEDRERFITTLRLLYDLHGDAGRKIYGPKYTNIEEINILHMDKFTQLRCTPWHDGDVFMTGHQSFVLWLEQSLQAVDPRISVPYWDFTYEIATDCSRPEKNSYCRLTNSYNNDPTKVLSRANSVCGMKTTVGWPTCELLRDVLAPANYTETVSVMEQDIHGQLHMQLGGIWDCPFGADTAMALSPGNAKLHRFIEYATVESSVLLVKNMVSYELIQCPDRCEEGTPFEDCLCYCPQMHKDIAAGLSLYNASWNILEAADLTTGDPLYEALDSLPSDQAREELIIWYAGFACTPGKFSPFGSPFGSVMDPIFASTHGYYDYLMQGKMLLSGDEAMTLGWYNNDLCWGHEWLAQLPFHDFEDEHNKQYTNQDLQQFFRPNNPSLPYVFDDYSFEHCGKVEEPI